MLKFSFSETPLSVYEKEFEIQVPLQWSGPGSGSGSVRFDRVSGLQRHAVPGSGLRALSDRPGPSSPSTSAAGSGNPPKLTGGAVPLSEARRVSASTAVAGGSRDFGALLETRGLFAVLLLIFLGGLALNLTPCVYPVIPLTVGFFGREAQGSTARAFALSSLYVLGMATTYSVLGVAAALSGKLFGAFLQNPLVLAVIAGILVAMALSMFGLWEIRLPTALMNKAGARNGPAGAFGMGLFVGVVAAPCVGGFIVGLLAFVAARQDPWLGLPLLLRPLARAGAALSLSRSFLRQPFAASPRRRVDGVGQESLRLDPPGDGRLLPAQRRAGAARRAGCCRWSWPWRSSWSSSAGSAWPGPCGRESRPCSSPSRSSSCPATLFGLAALRRRQVRGPRTPCRHRLLGGVVPAVPRAGEADVLRRPGPESAGRVGPLQSRHDEGRLRRDARAWPRSSASSACRR